MQKITSFYEMLKYLSQEYAEHTAIVYDTVEVTYERLFADAVKKALHLQRFPGKRIAIYGPASYRWIVNMFGAILAGKDLVLIDFFLPQQMCRDLLEEAQTEYILCSTNQYILSDASATMIPNAEKDDVSGLVYDENTPNGNVIFFTATAEDSDKAVILSNENIFYALEAFSAYCKCTPQDRVLAQISLHQTFGFIYSLMWPLVNGACVCVGRGLRHMDADTYYYSPTILPGNPSMLKYLSKIKGFNPELHRVVIGGAACPYHLFENLMDLDLEVYTIYGATESTCCIGFNDSEDGSFQLCTPDSVRIAEDGEVLVQGACVMQGYDHDDATTTQVIRDGFLHTGDYGHINNAGRLVLTRRNPAVIELPTGECISRKVTNAEITALNGIAESYIFVYEDKLTAVIVPIDKEARQEKFKRKIDKFNEEKGYRWEIQRIILLNRALPRNSEGEVAEGALEDILMEQSLGD